MAQLRERAKVLSVTAKSILAIETFTEQYDAERDRDKIESRLTRLDQLFDRYVNTSIALEVQSTDGADSSTAFSKERQEMEDRFYAVRDFLLANRAQAAAPDNTPAPQASTRFSSSVVRLPKLNLPTFDGEVNNWIPFRDAYKSLIHNNKDLAAIDKFHYLMAALKDPVKKLLDTTCITADNYKIAWELLVNRFDNKRLLIKNHISSLYAIEPVRKESSTSILALVDQFERHVKILTTLGEPTDTWDSLLVHMVCSRLDQNSLREWERSTGNDKDKIPTYAELIVFLQEQARILLSLNSGNPPNPVHKEKPRFSVSHAASVSSSQPVISSNSFSCVVCNQSHRIYECEAFRRMQLDQKHDTIRRKKLCWNCLSSSHISRDCPSKSCRKCNQKHHTLLHPSSPNDRFSQTQAKPTTVGSQPTAKGISSDSPTHTLPPSSSYTQPLASAPPRTQNGESVASTSQLKFVAPKPTFTNALTAAQSTESTYSIVLLSTALVKVYGPSGKVTLVRTLLDSCSEANFITERIVQLLGLKRTKLVSTISGMGGAIAKSTHCTTASFSSVDSSYSQTLTFSILSKITNDLPARPVNISCWKLPPGLVLADPGFATPQKIDMVIGAQLFFRLLCDGQMSIGDGTSHNLPVLQRTVLGWVVSGPVSNEAPRSISTNVALLATADELDQQLAQFWDLESCSETRGLSKEEMACEELFIETTTRDESGRFVVRLPKKEHILGQLGDSEYTALRRFHWMQRRLTKNPELKTQYCGFMQEYMELGHMIPVDTLQDNTLSSNSYYLPHHAVIKPSSTTTKCRVVFDGSSKSSTGISLNECLMVGPTIQETLFSIVTRIRLREIALVADITKMYRQIWIHPDDRHLQRIFWQPETNPDVQPYELTTVTYGTASAPYLATRCLQQLSFDHSEDANDTAAKIGKDFYVDDFLSGADTISEAKEICSTVQNILNTAGFELRKWSSNSLAALSEIPYNLKDDRSILQIDNDASSSISTLGLLWHPESDTFRFKVPEFSHDRPITKRIVASEMAKLFDPLGILGPVVIKAKIFVQQLWKAKLAWDEPLSTDLCIMWEQYRRDLATLNFFAVPRLVKAPGSASNIQIHGFCDASEYAYGACIYIRSVGEDGRVIVRLLAAKSRVAPVQSTTIPRLELCSAVLLSQLYSRVALSLNIITNAFFWSDSMVTLHWLSNPPSDHHTFVKNRSAKVQRLTEGCTWKHIAGLENPADIISRGANPSELFNTTLWWKGPPWLTSEPAEWPDNFSHPDPASLPLEVLEKKPKPTYAAVSRSAELPDHTLFEEYSSLKTLIRTAANCRRFVQYCRTKNDPTSSGEDSPPIAPIPYPYLTSAELNVALVGLVKVVQQECFSHEIALIQAGKLAEMKKSPLRTLNPFIQEGVLRVGGRLNHSSYPFTRKHPMLLPAVHPFTTLLVETVHKQLLHAGPRLMIAHIRDRFWPLNLRNLARRIVTKCVPCFRVQPRPENQLMGQLPKVRITPARAFLNTGVDFCGPVLLKVPVRRTKPVPPIKAYIAVFVCMATKAVHFELVGDLSTEGFIGALKRFVARRGRPANLYCDNATNFTGADKELQTLLKQFINQQHYEKVASYCAETTIQFHFIPARAPTFGGLWEAAVKALKHHLRRVVGLQPLPSEEMQTVLYQIESCLNSRPLTALSEDPSDLEVLTPGHFLVGSALQAIPEPDLAKVPVNKLAMWQAMQQRTQQFWKLWSLDYLHQLQQRTKNCYQQPNVVVGKLVLLKDDNLPPLKWSVARITAVRPGADGIVRVVTVKVPSGKEYDRPIVKVCLLPVNDTTPESTEASEEATGGQQPSSTSGFQPE